MLPQQLWNLIISFLNISVKLLSEQADLNLQMEGGLRVICFWDLINLHCAGKHSALMQNWFLLQIICKEPIGLPEFPRQQCLECNYLLFAKYKLYCKNTFEYAISGLFEQAPNILQRSQQSVLKFKNSESQNDCKYTSSFAYISLPSAKQTRSLP